MFFLLFVLVFLKENPMFFFYTITAIHHEHAGPDQLGRGEIREKKKCKFDKNCCYSFFFFFFFSNHHVLFE